MEYQKTNMIAWNFMPALQKGARKCIFQNTVFGDTSLLTTLRDISNVIYVLETFL
jgi:hypothetical protein